MARENSVRTDDVFEASKHKVSFGNLQREGIVGYENSVAGKGACSPKTLADNHSGSSGSAQFPLSAQRDKPSDKLCKNPQTRRQEPLRQLRKFRAEHFWMRIGASHQPQRCVVCRVDFVHLRSCSELVAQIQLLQWLQEVVGTNRGVSNNKN
jgi:hypothetical protein